MAGRRTGPVPIRHDIADRIEQAATRLFILHGYNGASYLDIARELGMTHSAIHYYYRTKPLLAEAVLRRVADATMDANRRIWTDADTSLFDKFVRTRDWVYGNYLRFNPGGKGGKPWGLLSRFSMEADSLTPAMKRLIRRSLDKMEDFIGTGVQLAVQGNELRDDAPVDGITLQIVSVMSITGQITPHASGFERLDDLMRWTFVAIRRAYGRAATRDSKWPALPIVPSHSAPAGAVLNA
jgi:AcrR family transcriptional regulator